MARVNDVTIRLLADVTKLKTGFSSAGQSVKQLSAQVQSLTNGQIKLTSAGRFYDSQRKQFISTAKAEQVITKALQKEYTRTQTAVTAVANATKAAVQAEMEKVNASKSLAQISKETIAMYSASGNAVQHLTARLVALTKGEYLLTASGKILNATTKEEVTLKNVAASATQRLAMEQTNLRLAYGQATEGMDAAQKRLLDTQMAMTGLSSITGSASFAAISMGQIFQDMGQFGMGAAQGVRAITNNVQQTVQSLVMLSAMTAKGESVFKAFTTALKGPVGFLVAFSLVTGAIEFFSNVAQRANKDANQLKDSFAALFQVQKTGSDVTLASSGRAELLAKAYRALSEEQKNTANASATFISAGVGSATKVLDENGRALMRTSRENAAYAKSLQGVAEESKRNEEAYAALENKIGINGIRVENLTAKNKELADQLRILSEPLSDEASALDASNKILQDRINAIEELKSLQESLIEDTASRMSETAAGLEDLFQGMFELPEGELDLGERLDTIGDQAAAMAERMREVSLETEEAILNFELPDGELGLGKALETEADAAEKALERMNKAFQNTVRNGITDMIVGLGELASGEGNVAQKLLLPIADMAINLGKIAIGTAIALEGIKNAFKSMNPVAALAAGVALVALGSAVKSRIRAVGERAASGTSSSSSAGIIRGGSLSEFNVGNLYGGTPGAGSAAGFPSLSIGSMAPQGMQLQLVARGPDLVSAVDAQRSANTRLIGGSR